MLAKLLLLPTVLAVSFSASCGSTLPAGVPPSGKMYFGTSFARKSGALIIVGKKSTFHSTGKIAWVAHFDQNANATKLTLELFSVQAGSNKTLSQQSTPSTTNINEKAVKVPVSTLIGLGAGHAGRYG